MRVASVGMDIGGESLLDDVSLIATAGHLLVITGPSGSGKSTLAHILAGLIQPTRGEVLLSGTALTDATSQSEQPSIVTQDFGLVEVLTAAETVSLPLRVRALAKDEIRDRTARWLGALGLEACADRPVEELSGGQRQRVAIARALAKGSDILIMDEPTAELDPTNRALLMSLLEEEMARGVTLVIVSHEVDVVARADAIYDLPGRR
jgi:putative ABC transport system ATP-binding protein